jgi:hypothetical protein
MIRKSINLQALFLDSVVAVMSGMAFIIVYISHKYCRKLSRSNSVLSRKNCPVVTGTGDCNNIKKTLVSNQFIALLLEQYRLNPSGTHGLKHWARGATFGAKTGGNNWGGY